MIKHKFRIIEPTEGNYYVEKTTYFYKWRLWIKVIGEYCDEEESQIPFGTFSAAKEMIIKLQK